MTDAEGTVYIKTGMFSGVPGVLARHGDTLSLRTAEGERFRVPLAEATIEFPRRYFGGAMTVTIGGTTYVLAFSAPGGTDTSIGDGLGARRSSTAWREILGDGSRS